MRTNLLHENGGTTDGKGKKKAPADRVTTVTVGNGQERRENVARGADKVKTVAKRPKRPAKRDPAIVSLRFGRSVTVFTVTAPFANVIPGQTWHGMT